jgi:Phage capsid family
LSPSSSRPHTRRFWTLCAASIYPALRDRGMGLSFDAAGTAYIPSLTAGGANGSFFAEGSPMRVGRITTASTTMSSRKMGVIIPFSREAAKRSTPNLEQLVRKAMIDDTSAILDSVLLDAVAGDNVRPAGLLNGVTAIGSGYGGGDYTAVIADFTALMAPFIAANAADGITVVMNPSQGFNLSVMPSPLGQPGWFSEIQKRMTVVESTHATAKRLIAIRNGDFATALGDAPVVMPRTATHTTAGVAALYAAAGTAVGDLIRLSRDRIKIAIASGGATKTGQFQIVMED